MSRTDDARVEPQSDAPAAGPSPAASGRFAYEGLERAIHEKARLGILTSLVANPRGLLFNDLKELCNLTDGNLSRHLQVLHDGGLVEVWKGYQKRRPQTLVRLTDEGRRRFLDYIVELEHVVADALTAAREPTPLPASPRSEGWAPA
jgi:DNA-binding MarR family transcriptional regulator